MFILDQTFLQCPGGLLSSQFASITMTPSLTLISTSLVSNWLAAKKTLVNRGVPLTVNEFTNGLDASPDVTLILYIPFLGTLKLQEVGSQGTSGFYLVQWGFFLWGGNKMTLASKGSGYSNLDLALIIPFISLPHPYNNLSY